MDLRDQLQQHLGGAYELEREVCLAGWLQQANMAPLFTAADVGEFTFLLLLFA